MINSITENICIFFTNWSLNVRISSYLMWFISFLAKHFLIQILLGCFDFNFKIENHRLYASILAATNLDYLNHIKIYNENLNNTILII